jgi:hypothetical protein
MPPPQTPSCQLPSFQVPAASNTQWLASAKAPLMKNLKAPLITPLIGMIAVLGVLVDARSQARAESPKSLAGTVDFEKQIRPLLAEHCLACHGFDPATRESGLRLDIRQSAIDGGDSGVPAIVPGDPAASELLRRVTSEDEDEMMPPPTAHEKRLAPEQIELLNRWISEGAETSQHWAFVSPKKADMTANQDDLHPQEMPIDFFVQQTLASQGLSLAPPESAGTLCRRIYLDIIGLPPTPEQLADFEREGLNATVDRLLSSERFGERWARPWMDVARYSDTNGYEKDMPRDQWAWRDWVIDAFNADMPYDQFIIEQIAGDLLPNATQQQRIATGFLRNSMINEEGAVIPEEFRMAEMFDRIDCVGKAVLGLTTQCAQCHTHKFDPLTHEEYFGLFAYLNDTYEAQSWVYSGEQLEKISEIQSGIRQIEDEIRAARPGWMEELQAWSSELFRGDSQWETLEFVELDSVGGVNHPTQEADRSVLMRGHRSEDTFFIALPRLDGITGVRLELLTHSDFPFRGPGNGDRGSWDIREFELFLQTPDSDQWQKQKLVNASADFFEVLTEVDEGKKRFGPVDFLIDQSLETSWRADRGLGRRNSASVAVVQLESPIHAPEGSRLKFVLRMGEMVGCCRISLTRCPQPVAAQVDYGAQLVARIPAEDRSQAEQSTLFAAWIKSIPELKPLRDRIDGLWSQFPAARTSVLHLMEREPAKRRQSHLLTRGEWNQPEFPVEPHVPEALHPLESSREPPRLQLARWLVDRRSPLAARVAVNRVWQTLFGQGLVETPEDFGTRTPVPLHRQLLDWLAVDFMDNGWSTKHLIRQIVSSRTYQQASRVDPAILELDPENRLLARGPRFRADAEIIRDFAMAVSGLIHHELGGPSVIPPVPQNVLDYNYVVPRYWTPAEKPARYRRTVYGFRKRSMPDPAMSSLDAPNADSACARRVRSNTPLAALTGLNEPIFVESARGLGLRILREAGPTDADRVDYGFLLCMSRYPTDAEREAILSLIDSQRLRVAEGWLNPREISTGDSATLPDLPDAVTPQDAAVWTIAARVLLNLDETLCKN